MQEASKTNGIEIHLSFSRSFFTFLSSQFVCTSSSFPNKVCTLLFGTSCSPLLLFTKTETSLDIMQCAHHTYDAIMLYTFTSHRILLYKTTSYSVCLPISVHFSLQASPDEMPIFHLCGKTCCCTHTYKCHTYTYITYMMHSRVRELLLLLTCFPETSQRQAIPLSGFWSDDVSDSLLSVCLTVLCCWVYLLWFLAGDSLLAPPSFPANNFNLLCGRLMYRNIN